jgi:U1 small nuclear ribonucleoprotein C
MLVEIGYEKAQSVIDSITNSYAAEGQASSNPMLQNPMGMQNPMMPGGFPPPHFGFPPGPGGSGMPPPPFGMPMPGRMSPAPGLVYQL